MESEAGTNLEALLDGHRAELRSWGLFPTEVEELDAHMRDRIEDLVQSGMDESQAFARARQEIGVPDQLAAEMREGRRPRHIPARLLGLLESVSGGLLLNYLRVIGRTLRRDRGYTSIGALGLAIGVALCLLLVSYVRFELRYDAMHVNSDRVYRVAKGSRANTPGAWAPELSRTFPEVDAAVRIMDGQFERAVLKVGSESIRPGPGIVADSALFDVFSWTLSRGNPRQALAEPGSVVLSHGLATRLFGPDDPIGRVIRLSGAGDFPAEVELSVTGLLAEPGSPSHLEFDFVVSMATVNALDRAGEWGTPLGWTNPFVKTYVLLYPQADPEAVTRRFPSFLSGNIPGDRYRTDDVFLQPLAGIHLNSRLRSDPPGSGGIAFVYLMLGLSVLILVIAIANFVNLAVARSMKRVHEIGLRKAVGANRTQLATQFLGESLSIALLATFLAIPLVLFSRPTFELLSGRPLPLDAVLGSWMVPFLLALSLLLGLASGWYPTLLLCRYQPTDAFRSGGRGSPGRSLARGLVVAQFVVTIGLIAVAMVFAQQMDFVSSRDLRYSPEDVVVVPIGQSDAIKAQADAFSSRLALDPAIESVATAHSIPSAFLNQFSFQRVGADVQERVSLRSVSIGAGFFDTIIPDLEAGRLLDAATPGDSLGFVLNQSAARSLGFSEPSEAVGQEVEWLMSGLGFTGTVQGVIRDFHFGSLREPVPPIVFHVSRFGVSFLLLRAVPGQAATAIQAAAAAWEQVEPIHAFESELLVDRIDAQYAGDQRMARIFSIAAGVAILLACLGLFGLTAFTIERRRTELGVRKVLGASTPSLIFLFCRQALQWIALALVLATPLAWVVLDRWLSGFAYHTTLNPIPFVIAGSLAAGIAVLAISTHTLGSAVRQPIAYLRSQ